MSEQLKDAQDQWEQGKSNKDITESGNLWYNDNGNWKIEISNKNAASDLSKIGTGTTLDNVLKNQSILFLMYPNLSKINVKYKQFDNKTTNASFSNKDNTIYVSEKFKNSNKDITDTILHEVQHAIQRYEGFETGRGGEHHLKYADSYGETEAALVASRKDLTQNQIENSDIFYKVQEEEHKRRLKLYEKKYDYKLGTDLKQNLSNIYHAMDDAVYNLFKKANKDVENETKENTKSISKNNNISNSDSFFDKEQYRRLEGNRLDDIAPTKSNDIRFSLSVQEANTGTDNDGRTLSKGQQDYFKDSKATDENGNLVTVYHTTSGTDLVQNKSSFYEFNPVGTPYYRYGNQVVNFFTDSQDMSGSYVDQNYTQADTSKIESLDEAQSVVDYYNGSGFIDWEIRENNGKYELYDNENDEVVHTFETQDDLFRNIRNEVIEQSGLDADANYDGYQYEGYLNLTNPYIVDAKGSDWNRIMIDNMREFRKNVQEKWDVPERQLDRLEGDTLKELNRDLTKIGFQLMNDEYGDLCLYTKSGKLAIDMLNVNDVMQEIRSDFREDATDVGLSTNDIVFQVLAENEMGANYDGVIFQNVLDYGGAAMNEQTPNNVYVTFAPNQFKSFDNQNPTTDNDIRYSLTPSGEMQDSNGNKVTLETSDTGTTGTLMAIHNLNESKLKGILELGGFPVPSIAVTKVDNVGSNQFGDITVLFDKSTIDPAIRENEVYDRDVWTPTFPTFN